MTTSYKSKRMRITTVSLILVLLSLMTASCSDSENRGQITADQAKRVLKKESISIEDAVLEVADRTRADLQLPQRMGDWELYDVKAEGRSLVYEYRAHSANVNTLTESEDQLQNQVCAAPDMRFSLDLGITFVYRYYDSAETVLGEASVSPSDCSQ